ncbi:unnamed protein product, partial [Owenia fusiformis]
LSSGMASFCRKSISLFFEYDTPKIVHIRSKKVGVINRLIQLAIIGYIIGWAIVWKKGYQETDSVESGVTTKLKGVAYTNSSLYNITNNSSGIFDRIWDVADYVNPPQENNAFFVMTNMVITPSQAQGECPEDPSMGVLCDGPQNCSAGDPVINGNGVMTGACSDPYFSPVTNSTVKSCIIKAWCPVEIDLLPVPEKAILAESKDFTVLIKNNIQFPLFKVKRRNIPEAYNNDTYLKRCRWNAEKDPYCPIFTLESMTDAAGENYEEMAVKGGVMNIIIRWDCNLDYDPSECVPKYEFRRLDDKDAKISKGWNFRYAYYYEDTKQKTQRTLVKAYGIRWIISVHGTAGKFNFVPLLLNFGSGIALLSLATIVCDIITLYVLKMGTFYKEKKYFNVTGDDAFEYEALPDHDDDESSSGTKAVQRKPVNSSASNYGTTGEGAQ